MTPRQTLRHRQTLDRWARQQCWRPDFRDGPLDAMLVGACVLVFVLAAGIVACGGAT